MNLNHVIIDLYPFSEFLIECLKKSCTVNLSHFLTNMICSTRNSMVFGIIVQQNALDCSTRFRKIWIRRSFCVVYLSTYKKGSTLSIIISTCRNLITMSEFVLLFMIGSTLI